MARDWRGSVRAKNGWLLLAVKDARGRWVERSSGLRALPANWEAARALLAERRAAWVAPVPAPPEPAPPEPPPSATFRGPWRNSRNRSLKRRRGAACEVCGWRPRPPLRDTACNAHHVRPRSEGGDDSDENRIILCPNHHAVAHALHRERPATDRADLIAQLRAWDAAADAGANSAAG